MAYELIKELPSKAAFAENNMLAYCCMYYDGHKWQQLWFPKKEIRIGENALSEFDEVLTFLLKRAFPKGGDDISEYVREGKLNHFSENVYAAFINGKYVYVKVRLVLRQRESYMYVEFYGKDAPEQIPISGETFKQLLFERVMEGSMTTNTRNGLLDLINRYKIV